VSCVIEHLRPLFLRCIGVMAGVALNVLVAGCATGAARSGSEGDFRQFFDEAETVYAEEAILRSGVLFSLNVEVDGSKEIEVESLRVSSAGDVVLPLLGSVELGERTLPDASRHLTALYAPYFVGRPIVRLSFSDDNRKEISPWGYVTVLGRVRRPGRVNLPPTCDMTVSAALQGADGFASSANLKAVRISRTDADGNRTQVVVDMNRIGADGDAVSDIRLRAGDVIFVPERIF
jgi:protein involved in polysaccharide export with SLBB domain